MFRPEHKVALRRQIQSLAALKLPEDHPFAAEVNAEIASQALLLEEIRIEIHNQLLGQGKPALGPIPHNAGVDISNGVFVAPTGE